MSRRWLHICLIVLLVGTAATRAHAASDRVSFLHDIEVSDTEEAEDAVCFLCSIRINGTANGDAVAFLGSVHVNGEIKGDVVSFLGDVAMGDGSKIGGDCVVFGGPLRRHDNTSIGGDTVQLPLIVIMLPFIILGLLIYGLIALVRHRRYAAYPMPPPRIR
jgi:hypothetical protein